MLKTEAQAEASSACQSARESSSAELDSGDAFGPDMPAFVTERIWVFSGGGRKKGETGGNRGLWESVRSGRANLAG